MVSELPIYASPKTGAEARDFFERPRVLVAEDNRDVLAAIGLLLRNNGYETDFVMSPAEVPLALAGKRFDAALLDLNYSRDTTSGAEGLELLSTVQALDPSLSIVAMTAWATIDLAVGAMHRGACEFVQKPWDNTQLVQLLNRQIRRTRELRRKRLNEELEQQEAAEIQRGLFPSQISAPDGLTIVASSQSARIVGGDYYDVVRIDEHRSAICIADVMGKGVAAALLMSNLQAAVRMLASHAAGPRELCSRANEMIAANGIPGKFITFFYCIVDTKKRSITYTNAGHCWPILAHRDGHCERLNTKDVVLGTVGQWSYHQQEVELRSGDRLVLFTDGITESTNNSGAEFGEDRLQRLVSENVHMTAAEMKELILSSIGEHSGILTDDATLIVAAIE